MWLNVWKAVVAFLAFIGALVSLLIGTLVVLAVLQTTGEQPAGQPEPAENLQYLVTNCGLTNVKILSIDKRHESSYDDRNGSDAGYIANAYAMKLTSIDSGELTAANDDVTPDWHRLRETALPYLSRSALQFYLAYAGTAKTPDWLPKETQLMSGNYYLRVNQISFDGDRANNAAICILQPTGNLLHVISINHW